jgi:hypothetical protein
MKRFERLMKTFANYSLSLSSPLSYVQTLLINEPGGIY